PKGKRAGPEALAKRSGKARPHKHTLILKTRGEYRPQAVKQSQALAVRRRKLHLGLDQRVLLQAFLDPVTERVQTVSLQRRNHDIGSAGRQPPGLSRIEEVSFVPDVQTRSRGKPKVFEQRTNGVVLLFSLGV